MRLSSGTAIIDRAPSPRKLQDRRGPRALFSRKHFRNARAFSCLLWPLRLFLKGKVAWNAPFLGFPFSVGLSGLARSETPRYILVFPLSPAPAYACLMLIPISASLLAM